MTTGQAPKDQGIPATAFDHVDLWKFFANQAFEIKQAMFGAITWIVGFAAAICGFIANTCLGFEQGKIVIAQPLALLLLSTVGIFLVFYADIVLRDYGRYMQKHFDRSDRAQTGRMALDEIIGDTSDKGRVPNLCNWIRLVTWTFGLAFLTGILVTLLVLTGQVTPILGWN